MTPLLGPADADHYRQKVGDYRERWYIDPLPDDDIAPATTDAWPSFTTTKVAFGKNWEWVGYGRIADWLETRPHELDGLNRQDRYDRIKQIAKSGLKVAGNRGTDVHTMFEAQLRGQVIDDRMLAEEAREYRPAVDAFFHHYQPVLYAAELVGIHRTLHGSGYGCTADAILQLTGHKTPANLRGKLLLVDWKSRKEDGDHDAYPEEIAQLGAGCGTEYIILDDKGPKRAYMPPLDAGLIVSVRPNGCRVFPIDLSEAWLQYEGLHAWWERRRTEKNAKGQPWPPIGHVDLFQLIADCENDREAFLALREAHKGGWTEEATARVKARLAGTQTHLTAVR